MARAGSGSGWGNACKGRPEQVGQHESHGQNPEGAERQECGAGQVARTYLGQEERADVAANLACDKG